MKSFIHSIVILIFCSSCNLALLGQEAIPQEEMFIHSSSKISYNHKGQGYRTFKILEGDSLVFEATQFVRGDEGNHSLAKTKIAFQIEQGADEFSLKDEEINAHSGVYMQMCKCQDVGIQRIKKGVINGKQLEDGSWIVEMNVSFPGRVTHYPYHIEQSLVFRPAS